VGGTPQMRNKHNETNLESLRVSEPYLNIQLL